MKVTDKKPLATIWIEDFRNHKRNLISIHIASGAAGIRNGHFPEKADDTA